MFYLVFVAVVLLYTTAGAVVENQKKGGSCSGVGEEWRETGPVCQATCDQVGEEVCCEVGFIDGCFCADSYIRDHKGRCVLIKECPRPGVLTFNQTESVVLEGASVASVGVSRVGGSRGRVTVRWRVVLPAPSPYSGVEGVLNFEEGVIEQSINVQLVDNNERNPDVLLQLELFEPSRKTSLNRKRTRLVIKDDDMRPGYLEMAEGGVSVVESEGMAVIQVVRVDGSDGDLTVQWRVVGGTAKVGVDFLEPAPAVCNLNFAEGETENRIEIKIVDDEVREAREEFEVELFDQKAGPGVINFRAKGPRTRTVVHIEDDDMSPGYPEMASNEISVTEGGGRVTIRVVRHGGRDGEIGVHWRVIPGSAFPLLDYLLPGDEGGRLVFAENVTEQRIFVRLVDDEIKEEDETFRVELFDPQPGPGVIKFRARGTAMATDVVIRDDDMTPGVLEFERSRHVISERVDSLRVWVVRVGGTDGEVGVHWRTVVDVEAPGRSRAEPGVDFKIDGGLLVFAGRESRKFVKLQLVDDARREPEESFAVELYDPQSGPGTKGFKGIGGVRRTTIVIHDDDMSPGVLQLESSSVSVAEGVGVARLGVERVGGAEGDVRVHWEATGRGRGFFVPSKGELVFHEGETSKEIAVPLLDDAIRNRVERRFEVRLFDPTAGLGVVNFKGLGERTSAVVTVLDDDMNTGRLVLGEPEYSLRDGKFPLVTIPVLRVDGRDGRLKFRWKTKFDEREEVLPEGVTKLGLPFDLVKLKRADFELELFDVRTDLDLIDFRGTGDRTTVTVRLTVNPGFLDLELPAYSVSEGGGVARVGVVRLNGSEGRVSVRWRTRALTAKEGVDFVAAEGELVFEEGEVRPQFVEVRLVDDGEREEDEQFAVELVGETTDGPGLVNLWKGKTRRTIVTIRDDDMHPGVLNLESSAYSVSEGTGVVRVGVVRLNGSEGRVSVQWRTLGGTATGGSDFVAAEGELVFEDGVKLLFVEVRIVDDEVREDFEEFTVEVVDLRGLAMKAIVTILDDDSNAGTFGFRDKHVKVSERAGVVTLWVVRSDGTDGRVKLKWRTTDGTAGDGVDFAASGGGLLQFEDGELERSFFIPVLDRKGRGGDRAFTVGLFDPSDGGRLGTNSLVTVLIHDEEDSVRIFFRNSTVQVSRGSPEVTLEVERSGGDLSRPVSVLFQTVDGTGTAKADADFRRTRGLITFPPPSFAMRVRVLVLPEKGEGPRQTTPIWFMARISNPSEGEVVQGRDLLVVWIVDSEAPQAKVERIETTRDEGTRDLEFRGIPQTKEITCPAGMTANECAPACQGVCPGLDPVCPPPAPNGCVKGCFCPPGMLLDHTLARCVTLGQCTITPPPPPVVVTTSCPAGMTMRECAPSCQGVCPGLLEPVCQHDARRGGCVKGCFCPPGMLLDNTLTRCLLPDQCTSSGGAPAGVSGQLVGNFGDQSAGFQVKVDRTKVEGRGGVQPPLKQQQAGGVCPAGLTFKECAPACQATCPGLEPASCRHGGGCVKGCFCPPGQVLDHSLATCIHPSRCGGGQSERNAGGLAGGLLGGLLG